MYEPSEVLPSATDVAQAFATRDDYEDDEDEDEVDLSGSLLADRYRVIERLGSGGMGTVYLAEHVVIRKRFAIKVLSTSFWSKRKSIERFLQEARTASEVRHSNIVEITDFGYADKTVPFLVMELLEGSDLREQIKREGALPWPRVRTLMLQILAALEAAHAQGIIHRDIKPHNCFWVESSDTLKVLDFGLAKVIREDDEDYESLTRTGTVMGTPHYMSPEQANCEPLDVRADVYSAGVIAFELLTGRVPYQGRGFLGVLSKLLTEPIPAMADIAPDVQVPSQVEAAVRRAMAKDRDERYPSAAAFAEALAAIPDEPAAERRRPGLTWLAAGLALALLGGGAVYGSNVLRQGDLDIQDEPMAEAAVDPAPASTLPAAIGPAVEPEAERPTRDLEDAPAQDPTPLPDPPPQEPEDHGGDDESKSTSTKPRPKPRKSAQAADPIELPETLTSAQIQEGLTRAKCGDRLPMSKMSVTFAIRPDGTVSDPTLSELDRKSGVGSCVLEHMRKLRFRKSHIGVKRQAHEVPLE